MFDFMVLLGQTKSYGISWETSNRGKGGTLGPRNPVTAARSWGSICQEWLGPILISCKLDENQVSFSELIGVYDSGMESCVWRKRVHCPKCKSLERSDFDKRVLIRKSSNRASRGGRGGWWQLQAQRVGRSDKISPSSVI